MEAVQTVPELVAAAQLNAKVLQDRISEIRALEGDQNGSDPNVEELTAATAALELAAVDIFSVFEARTQHHFKRGPLSRKLKAALLAAGEADLADRVHQYYLATNVLKHGTGASYRELLNNKSTLVVLRDSNEEAPDDARGSCGLVDVTAAGFFDGLFATILDAYHFLESR